MSAEVRLQQFVRAECGRPFVWGDTNCVALALRAVDAMHGTALHAKHRRHMLSAARAQVWTRRHGLQGVVAALLKDGLLQVLPAYSQLGDILLGETDDGQIAAHICLGVKVLTVSTEAGVFLARRSDLTHRLTCAAGWRAQ